MTLPVSGAISAAQINVELSRVSGAPFSLDGAQERGLAGVGSGSIAFSSFHGKSSIIREPAQGEYYADGTYWESTRVKGSKFLYLYWFGAELKYSFNQWITQIDYNGWRYFRGEFKDYVDDDFWDIEVTSYAIYRIKL